MMHDARCIPVTRAGDPPYGMTPLRLRLLRLCDYPNKAFFGVFPGLVGQWSCVLSAYLGAHQLLCMFVRRVALLFPLHPQFYYPHFALMSRAYPASSSTSSNFQLIFDNALKTYKRRTHINLLAHPLANRLKACNSPSSILTVLQEQAQELNQSQRRNQKWLDPTVNVLYAFSEALGEDISLVWFRVNLPLIYPLIFFDRRSHLQR